MDSNHQPSPCKGDTLPIELIALNGWGDKIWTCTNGIKVRYATITLLLIIMEKKRIELLFSECKSDVLPLNYFPLGTDRIELSLPEYQSGFLTIERHAFIWRLHGELNPDQKIESLLSWPLDDATIMAADRRIELLLLPWQGNVITTTLISHICLEGDLNPQAIKHLFLRQVCIPIPSSKHYLREVGLEPTPSCSQNKLSTNWNTLCFCIERIELSPWLPQSHVLPIH